MRPHGAAALPQGLTSSVTDGQRRLWSMHRGCERPSQSGTRRMARSARAVAWWRTRGTECWCPTALGQWMQPTVCGRTGGDSSSESDGSSLASRSRWSPLATPPVGQVLAVPLSFAAIAVLFRMCVYGVRCRRALLQECRRSDRSWGVRWPARHGHRHSGHFENRSVV